MMPASAKVVSIDGSGEESEEQVQVQPEAYLMNERDMLAGLFAAAQDVSATTEVVKIERLVQGEKKILFTFRIHGLTEREYDTCREEATTYRRERKMGNMKLPEDTDSPKLRSWVIYTATHPDDRKALWENKTLWEKLNVLNAQDAIDRVLRAGEKDRIINRIEELSGFGEIEEAAGN